MPFEKGKSGNPLGRSKREKHFETALMLELKAAGEDMPSLRRIARKLLEKAEDGDMSAIKETADRLDGKVPQAIVGDGEYDPVSMLHRIERLIVNPTDQNGGSVPPAAQPG